MTVENITISLPMTTGALLRGSEMLVNMANDLVPNKADSTFCTAEPADIEPDTASAETADIEPDTASAESADIDLDSAGYPWDARIHGAKRNKTAKTGQWTKIKNLDKNNPGLFDVVIAELSAAGYGVAQSTTPTESSNVTNITSAVNAPPPAPSSVANTAVMYVHPDGNKYTIEQLRASGWADESIVADLDIYQEPDSVVDITFPELMALITPALTNGTISQEKINAALLPHGLSSLVLLSAQPQLVSVIKQALFG